MKYLDKLILNITEHSRRKYLLQELNEYEEYVKIEEDILKNEISDLNREIIICNISNAYFNMAQYDKAIESIRRLDDFELDDNMTFLYYVNSLSYYILNNQEEEVDYIYEESIGVMEKFQDKYPDIVDIYHIKYFNFKGRYEESLELLKKNRIKDKNSDYFNLILADIAFNTDEFDEGCLIISEMCKEYNKKAPVIKKQIDTFILLYMKNVNIEKNEEQVSVSLDNKLWNISKDSVCKTNLFYIYMYIKDICKSKLMKYAVMPTIITLFLCRIFFPLVYGQGFSVIFINIISFIFLTYFVCGLGYLIIKHTKNVKTGFLPAIVITFIVINILMAFFLLDFKGSILDLNYAISKTAEEEKGSIEKLSYKEQKNSTEMQLKIKNKIFILNSSDYLYDYISENFKEGEKVDIQFLPHTMNLISIEKSAKKS